MITVCQNKKQKALPKKRITQFKIVATSAFLSLFTMYRLDWFEKCLATADNIFCDRSQFSAEDLLAIEKAGRSYRRLSVGLNLIHEKDDGLVVSTLTGQDLLYLREREVI